MSSRKKSLWAILTVVTLLFNLMVPSFAQDLPNGADVGAQGAYGQITAISDTSISVLPRHIGETRTFSITPSTSILINNKVSSLDKLQVGRLAVVTSSDGQTTWAINEYVPRTNGAAALIAVLGIMGLTALIASASRPKGFSMPSLPSPPH